MCKKLVSFILALALCLAVLHIAAAENVIEMRIPVEISGSFSDDALPDSDVLAEGFIRKTMQQNQRLLSRGGTPTRGSLLEGTKKSFYDLLSEKIAKVANGELSSTVFTFSMEDIHGQSTFSPVDFRMTQFFDESGLTLEGGIARYLLVDFLNDPDFDFGAVPFALLCDFPYELYWFDKTKGYSVTSDSIGCSFSGNPSTSDQTITVSGNITISFSVLTEYAVAGEEYAFNTSYGTNARAAAANARQIVTNRAGLSDREKLVAYANDICALTSYNDEAAATEGINGNPWQLIWVFDNDPTTNVVCEGYAKAFKYLCDLSTFTGDISAILVSGKMSGGTGAGAHMWNVVRLNDGKNYLVDVTNIDSGTIGYPDKLLLVGYASGSFEEGYFFSASGGDVYYGYDPETTAYFSEEELTIAKATVYNGLTCITLPEGVTRVEAEALAGTNAQVIIIPADCTYVASDAFANCSQLVYLVNRSALTITPPSGVTVIDEHE